MDTRHWPSAGSILKLQSFQRPRVVPMPDSGRSTHDAVSPGRRSAVQGLAAVALTATSVVLNPVAHAASDGAGEPAYPTHPVRLIVPFAAGGPADLMARIVGKRLGEELNQPFVIENRPGAGGNVGTDAMAKARPDGYTIGLSAISSLAIAPGLYPKLSFDPKKDLVPIALVAITQGAIVAHPSVPFNDLKGMIEYAKANPGKLTYASPGVGTAPHLVAESLSDVAGIRLEHLPYKGTANASQDLLAGTIPLSFESSLTVAVPNVRSGRLKGIAITSARRSALLPDLRTVAEQGFPGFDVPAWFGLVGPAGMPAAIVDRIHAAVNRILDEPGVKSQLAEIGAEAAQRTRDGFVRYIADETVRWGRLIKQRNIRVE